MAGYRVIAELASDTISEAEIRSRYGMTVSGLTPGNLYAIESEGGPWQYRTVGSPNTTYHFSLHSSDLLNAVLIQAGQGGASLPDDVAVGAEYREDVDANHVRIYFRPAGTSILFGVREQTLEEYTDNSDPSGTFGYKLSSATRAFLAVKLVIA